MKIKKRTILHGIGSSCQESIDYRDISMVTVAFNAKVGKTATAPVVGQGGLGEANLSGARLLDMCMEHRLILTNTWFKHHPQRLYTWTSPDGHTRNQLRF